MTVQIGQYCINVTDLERSVAFYEDVIGLTVFRRVDYDGLQEVTLGADGGVDGGRRGGGRIQLASTDDLTGPIEHGNALRKIYFFVDDCAEVHQRAVDAGSPSEHAPERLVDYPVTFAMILDPDGYVIELVQRHDR